MILLKNQNKKLKCGQNVINFIIKNIKNTLSRVYHINYQNIKIDKYLELKIYKWIAKKQFKILKMI